MAGGNVQASAHSAKIKKINLFVKKQAQESLSEFEFPSFFGITDIRLSLAESLGLQVVTSGWSLKWLWIRRRW
jgi:hypothetical protein